MKYDFETKLSRRNMGATKWEMMYQKKPGVAEGVVPLSVADMEFKTPPEIVEGLCDFLKNDGILGYTIPYQEYNQSVIDFMDRRHDWKVKEEWLVTSPGVVPALVKAVGALTEPDEGIILFTPVYYPFFLAVNRNHRRMVECPLLYDGSHYELNLQDFEAKAKDPKNTCVIFCNPHNPVGRVWTKAELMEFGRICVENDILVLSDEIHFDLVRPGVKHHVFANLSPEFAQTTITCTAPSKSFNLAGMSASNLMISNPKLRKRYVDEGNHGLNILGFRACELAYRHCDQWLDQCVERIYQNADYIETYFHEELPMIKPVHLDGTYLQWVDFRALPLNANELEKFMVEKCDIYTDEGYLFGANGAGFERFNIACPLSVIQETLDRLTKGLKGEGLI